MPRNNTSDCPGGDAILELLRAEHEQVKRRTDIIKQLITYNCTKKSSSSNGLNKSQTLKDAITKSPIPPHPSGKSISPDSSRAISLNSQYQYSCNNRASRHARCFLPLNESIMPDRTKETREYSYTLRAKTNAPSFSAMQLANLKALNTTPTYSQFQNGATHQSTPKKPTKSNKSNSRNTAGNQTEDGRNQINAGYDYKLETHKLMQEVTDLKNASKRYEDEKSDWINEKRRQIRILQQLRDASCDETKAAMKLTSWKPSDIECNPAQYEESKRTWLLCKKNQIELLEQLRGVSLSEIKKGIERLSNSNLKGIDFALENDRCQSTMDFSYLGQNCGQEVYSSDKISVRLCGPEIKSECLDKEKININIMMKSNSNITEDIAAFTDVTCNSQKGAAFRQKKPIVTCSHNSNSQNRSFKGSKPIVASKTTNDTALNSVKCAHIKKPASSTSSVKDRVPSRESTMELKRQIEDTIGTKLFENTYNILSQLNCPQLIIKSDDGCTDAERVYNYILEERKSRYSSDEINLT